MTLTHLETVFYLAVGLVVLGALVLSVDWYRSNHQGNTYQTRQAERNDSVQLARTFDQPAPKGFRKVHPVVDIREERRRQALNAAVRTTVQH